MTQTHFDYFVIGGGSGGVRSARIAASHGAKVGLAEKSALGGTCVNVGCVPKKLFSYAADYGSALKEMSGYGWDVKKPDFNWSTLLQNKNTEIERLNGIYSTLLDKAGVSQVKGHGAFIDAHTIDIEGQKVTADKILIATGGIPRRPAFKGAEYAIVSDDAFYLDAFPQHVVIQGGGYVAVEFAHIFHGLGAKVTLLYRGRRWLRNFDTDIGDFLHQEYLKQGINILFEDDIDAIEKENNAFTVHTTSGNLILCDLVFSAIGRDPNVKNLNLKAANIATKDNGQIAVTENWQTSQPHIYAVGDVSNAAHLTPYAIAEGHILADKLFGKGGIRVVNLELVPTAIFSGPPIGTVGLSEEQAISKGHEIQIYKTDFKPMRHTLSGSEERTFMKLVVDKKSDKVLGCHMVGADTPEMLQGIAIAMNAGATKTDFDRTIGIHPTSAEELVTLK